MGGEMKMEHFNKLTPAQAERLAMLIEECGEVIQIAGKILRHGYQSYHPERPHVSNAQLLSQEVCDLQAVATEVIMRDTVWAFTDDEVGRAWNKKLRYAHHQEPCDSPKTAP
jgi:hypothetical protein